MIEKVLISRLLFVSESLLESMIETIEIHEMHNSGSSISEEAYFLGNLVNELEISIN